LRGPFFYSYSAQYLDNAAGGSIMAGKWWTLVILGFLSFAASGAGAAESVPLIYDTDMGNDVDDAMALAVILALESRGACKLLAVTVTKDHALAAPFCDALNTFYGRGDIPIGMVRGGVTPEAGRYLPLVETQDGGKDRYTHDLRNGGDAPDATTVLRETLAAQPDGSVVVLQVGFSTNLARLLDSPPDVHSPLDGRALVQKKVKLLSLMAGKFQVEPGDPHHLEYNIKLAIPAAKKVVADWPTEMVFSGWEIGALVRYPAATLERDYAYVQHHIVAEAYRLFNPTMRDQPLFDLTSVLYAVYPERGYFGLSPKGRVVIEDDAFTRFEEEPSGKHRYLLVDEVQMAQVCEALVQLCSQPPR
jgi:inosine-uridine nucleoside N-ribohydrolase